MAIARVYKIRSRSMNFPTQKHGLLTFANHRLLVEENEDNAELIQFIEKVMLKDPALGIYIDPKESTRDLDEYIQAPEVQHSDVRAFLQQQSEILPESATDNGAVNLMKSSISSTHDLSAKGAPNAQRFSAADVLRAKLQQHKAAETPTPIPDSTLPDPSNVATDANGNPIAEGVDPDELARAALNSN